MRIKMKACMVCGAIEGESDLPFHQRRSYCKPCWLTAEQIRTRKHYHEGGGKELARIRYENNKGYYRAKQVDISRRKRARDRAAVLSHYSETDPPSCQCCGNTYTVHLTIDHIGGGGTQHRHQLTGGPGNIAQWLRTRGFPEGYRVLCWNCNSATHLLGKCECTSRL